MDTQPQRIPTRNESLIMAALGLAALLVIVFFGLFLRAPKELAILDEVIQENDLQIYSIDPTIGPEQAKITIVEFADFGCQHCAESSVITKQLLKAYPKDVRIVWKGVPGIDTASRSMHHAALCAHLQGRFWEYHDLLFAHQNDEKTQALYLTLAQQTGLDTTAFEQCLTNNNEIEQLINRSTIMSGTLNISELPTFFINNSLRVSSVLSLDSWKKEVQSLLN
jgi:protein-disulfide isomerase